MPQLQVVDLGDDQYKNRKGIGRVFDEIQDAYKGHQERSAIDKILGEYQQNMGEAQAYEKAQLDLMRNNQIGPTKRLQIQGDLDRVQKNIRENDKALNAQYKSEIDSLRRQKEDERKAAKETKRLQDEAVTKANKQKESRDALKIAGYSDEEADAMSEYTSPEGARALGTKKIAKDKPQGILKGNKGQDERINKNIESGTKSKKLLVEAPILKQAIQNLGNKGQGWKSYVSAVPGGRAITEVAFDKDEQTINSIIKESLIKSGDLQGLRLTDYKLRYLEGASPSPYKSEEANMAAFEIWESRQKLASDTLDAQNELIKEIADSGATSLPADFDRQLEDRVEQLGLNKRLDKLVEKSKKLVDEEEPEKKAEEPAKKVRVRNKETGQTGSVTSYPGMEKKYDLL